MARQEVIKASEGHRSFGKLLKRVYNSDEHLIVERDGFPVAVLLGYQEYQQLRQQAALEAFKQFSREVGQAIAEQGLREAELLEAVQQAGEQIYQEQQADSRGDDD